MLEHQKPWNPLTVAEVSLLFARADFPWWIAGGFALELAIGRSIRSHSDIDVLVLRENHVAARELLTEWDCWVADPPGSLRPWVKGEYQRLGVHDIWCRKSFDDDWRLQIMIDEMADNGWMSRRNSSIRASLDEVTWTTTEGVPFLAPHIQLFYKAKSPRRRDEIDFDAVVGAGIEIDGVWLQQAIARCYGRGHPWLERLRENSGPMSSSSLLGRHVGRSDFG